MAKPTIDGLASDLEGQATVVQLDLLSEFGRQIGGIYQVRMVPTVLLFDGNGQVIERQAGRIDADPIRDGVMALYQ